MLSALVRVCPYDCHHAITRHHSVRSREMCLRKNIATVVIVESIMLDKVTIKMATLQARCDFNRSATVRRGTLHRDMQLMKDGPQGRCSRNGILGGSSTQKRVQLQNVGGANHAIIRLL